jgi:hypothetical protein
MYVQYGFLYLLLTRPKLTVYLPPVLVESIPFLGVLLSQNLKSVITVQHISCTVQHD